MLKGCVSPGWPCGVHESYTTVFQNQHMLRHSKQEHAARVQFNASPGPGGDVVTLHVLGVATHAVAQFFQRGDAGVHGALNDHAGQGTVAAVAVECWLYDRVKRFAGNGDQRGRHAPKAGRDGMYVHLRFLKARATPGHFLAPGVAARTTRLPTRAHCYFSRLRLERPTCESRPMLSPASRPAR